ncbi:hypothetical protein BH09BAC5_BH09BAC5_10960 [soil metagenome]
MRVGKLVIIIFCFYSFSLSAGRLEKGYEALHAYNYFKARDIFTKTLKHHSAAAGFGLATIYSRNDNPFYDVSLAHSAILMAQWGWTNSSQREKDRIAKLGVEIKVIESLKKKIDTLGFILAEKKSTVFALEEYLDEYCGSVLTERAMVLRDELAYSNAVAAGGWKDYKYFADHYPNAIQYQEAFSNYEQLLFESETADKSIAYFERLISDYTASPYIKVAEDSIFVFATPANNINQFYAFVKKYPNNRNVPDVWKRIYALYTSDGKPTTIAQFWIDYPDFPFKETISEDLRLSLTTFYPVVLNNNWGFCDSTGTQSILFAYDWVESFSEGLAAAGKNNKCGFISKNGKVAIPFEYDEVESFRKGFAQVKKNEKVGLTDHAGHLLVPTIYDEIGDFYDARAVVVRGGKYGYIDMFGTEVIPCKYDKAGDFSGGLAYVVDSSKYGYIDHTGKKITQCIYDWLESFDQGTARFSVDGKFGLRSFQGIEIIPPVYSFISPFREGIAMVVLDDKCGYIRRNGSFVLPCNYEYDKNLTGESDFHNGMVRVKNKGKVGMLDTSGKTVVPFEFDDILPFENGLAAVKKKDKWGFINLKMQLVIPYEYDWVSSFSDGIALVKSDDEIRIINTKQKEVINGTFTAGYFLEDYLYLNDGNGFGLFGKKGNIILPFNYSKIEFMSGNILRVERNSKFGYYNISSCSFIWKEEGLED